MNRREPMGGLTEAERERLKWKYNRQSNRRGKHARYRLASYLKRKPPDQTPREREQERADRMRYGREIVREFERRTQ